MKELDKANKVIRKMMLDGLNSLHYSGPTKPKEVIGLSGRYKENKGEGMKELKVGERVAVYLGGGFTVGVKRKTGIIVELGETETVKVSFFGQGQYWCHRKQCRRLKKKEKKKPREWWINCYNGHGYAYATKENAIRAIPGYAGTETILVREVIERKK